MFYALNFAWLLFWSEFRYSEIMIASSSGRSHFIIHHLWPERIAVDKSTSSGPWMGGGRGGGGAGPAN